MNWFYIIVFLGLFFFASYQAIEIKSYKEAMDYLSDRNEISEATIKKADRDIATLKEELEAHKEAVRFLLGLSEIDKETVDIVTFKKELEACSKAKKGVK